MIILSSQYLKSSESKTKKKKTNDLEAPAISQGK